MDSQTETPPQNTVLISVEPCSASGETLESPSKTPITALLSSIQRGFLFTPSSPLSPPQAYLTVASAPLEQMSAHAVVGHPREEVLPDVPLHKSLKQDFMDVLDRHALEAVDLN
ncbi:hypothetical protein HYDPIDRAFT_31446 [Hydnomerulius pinastri MD-312]|uniref:Uncharacterized protein n=1 Tax=Hydnomerulius pinastri MD-312 TaxID=994086 RepID=A0A0C9WC39_9AGAM|nr:hypothetical protein HYDPIDRAFT_31446 [Hydnomerulius pinastri MD-312]